VDAKKEGTATRVGGKISHVLRTSISGRGEMSTYKKEALGEDMSTLETEGNEITRSQDCQIEEKRKSIIEETSGKGKVNRKRKEVSTFSRRKSLALKN